MEDTQQPTNQQNFYDEFKKAPKWQQRTIAIIFLLGAVSGGFFLIDYAKTALYGSEKAIKIKHILEPLAETLDTAQKTGDIKTVESLLAPTTQVVEEYNNLSDVKRNAINQSSLRYCVLAAINLSGGVGEVLKTGYWVSRNQYLNSIDMCK